MRLVVTGANGYIGSNLIRYFKIHPTLAISRFNSNLADKTIYTDNLFTEIGIKELRDFKATHIIHAAGYAHKNNFFDLKLKAKMKSTNEIFTKKLFELCNFIGIPNFLYISSISVHLSKGYSNNIINENSSFEGKNSYSITKANAEILLGQLSKDSNTLVTILRPAVVYGRGAPGNFKKLISVIDKGFIFPFKGVVNKRSFLSINNFLSAVECCCLNKATKNRTFLIADKEKISTYELIKIISRIRSIENRQFKIPNNLLFLLNKLPFIGKTFRIFTKDLVIDTSLIKKELGWEQPHKQINEFLKAFSK